MKALNVITLCLVVLGGLNWGVIGMFNYDVLMHIFGAAAGLTRAAYVIIGVSALWQLYELITHFTELAPPATRGHLSH